MESGLSYDRRLLRDAWWLPAPAREPVAASPADLHCDTDLRLLGLHARASAPGERYALGAVRLAEPERAAAQPVAMPDAARMRARHYASAPLRARPLWLLDLLATPEPDAILAPVRAAALHLLAACAEWGLLPGPVPVALADYASSIPVS